MTIVSLTYPAIIVLFLLAAVGVGVTALLKRYNFVPAFMAGICTVALVIYALCVSLPTWELLSMLLILCVASIFVFSRGGKK